MSKLHCFFKVFFEIYARNNEQVKISDHYNKNLLFDLGNGELCNAQGGVLDNFEHGKLGWNRS